ncbi:glycoside hydrolase family 36 protein [Durotheca rogersii]|uniref:glycoside hydrolase family 36 protein n=1 Tax=Durotheca rogersii TaxID=419775 RepID=UPI00221E3D05|nr:glycoside hydrolase family 36 protein [Durotheca rogersii]KAI5864854.1 glycoside hydrolase family 36 protein [Durotheca rogersii]
MEAGISSFPPLGQVTQIRGNTIEFFSLLEVDKSRAGDAWEVAVWRSSTDGVWSEKLLQRTRASESPTLLRAPPASRAFLYFRTSFFVSSPLNFTLKFRSGPDHPWRWARDLSGIHDGVVLIEAPQPRSRMGGDLSDIIHGLNPDLRVTAAASQTPHTELWSIEADVDPAVGDQSAYADVDLGTPWGGSLRYFAIIRHGSPWLGPRHSSTSFSLDKDAVVCSFLNHRGKHLVLLGVSGVANVTTLFRSSGAGSVKLHIRNDNGSRSSGLVLAAVGDNFESAIAAVMYHARTVILATRVGHDELSRELQSLSEDVRPEWYENWYDGLGYCTWNGLGQRLSDKKIIKAVEALAKSRINISSLIIDDNWQDIDYRGQDQSQYGWNGFEAEPKTFPLGLKETVLRIRAKHPSIQHVAVWHALLGYWGGISSTGGLAKKYNTVQVNRADSNVNGPITVIAKEDVRRFYDDFYRFLSDCGVDGVKADAQYMLDTWVSAQDRRELTDAYLDAWMISTLRHFSIKAISCMSQAPQILFYQQLPRNRPPLLVRNSTDFYPDVPDSHPWHIFANAYNTLFTQHLNTLPDWDMFQTNHEFAGFHAAARCLSGGPIYITDIPGKHDINIINQMTGPTPRGKTVIFRPSVVGKTIDAYTGYDELSILKIGSYNGRAVTGTPILGVFNISRQSLQELIPLSRFPGVVDSARYVVRAHASGLVTPVVQPSSSNAIIAVSLDTRGYDIFTAFPVTKFDSETNGEVDVANLGLIEKMTGAAAITTSQFELLQTGRVFLDARLKALGVLGVYISSLPDMSIERDFMVTIQGQPIPLRAVSVNTIDNRVLNVDIETAWKKMGLKAGWSNEVEVKVYFDIEYP